jgi:hypothetical protein
MSSCKPNYEGLLKAKRDANERALKITLAILGVLALIFIGSRMWNQPAKARAVAQQDFDYFKTHSASNAAVKLKYDQLAGANNDN